MSALRILSYGASSLGLLLIAIPVFPSAIASIQTAITTQQLEIEKKLAQDNIKRQE